jgi:hypothetical protein
MYKRKGKRPLSKKAVAAKYGFRSGFEHVISEMFVSAGLVSTYEEDKILYVVPASDHKYTPDFKIINRLGKVIYLETKGRWVAADIKKMKLIKEQHPDIDIRIIFQDASKKLTKSSKTTYGERATKLGYKWCDMKYGIPEDWFEEFK